MQLYNYFTVLVSGTSLFIVIKYTRLKPFLNIFATKFDSYRKGIIAGNWRST